MPGPQGPQHAAPRGPQQAAPQGPQQAAPQGPQQAAPQGPQQAVSEGARTMVILGRLTAPWGIKGWIKAESYTDPPAGILSYPVWFLSRPGARPDAAAGPEGWEEIRIVDGRPHGTGRAVVVSLPGVGDPEAARRWVRRDIAVPREALPMPPAGEYYWHDLEGCRVETLDGLHLGSIDHFVDLPANPVMVVKDGKRERWLPAVPEHMKRVDLAARLVVVDWDAEI